MAASKQASKHVRSTYVNTLSQCSPTSVGLAQAHPILATVYGADLWSVFYIFCILIHTAIDDLHEITDYLLNLGQTDIYNFILLFYSIILLKSTISLRLTPY